MWNVFLYGFAFGFGAAVFPGPINLEVIRRAISRGPVAAIAFGMGAVSADVLYVLAISAGAAALLAALPIWAQVGMYGMGAILLAIIGVKAVRAKRAPVSEMDDAEPGEDADVSFADSPYSLVRGYFLGLVLTLGSPPTVFYWLLMSVTATQHFGNGILFSGLLGLGVFTACTMWVIVVSLIIGYFHRHLNAQIILAVERTVGVLLICLAVYSGSRAAYLAAKHEPAVPPVSPPIHAPLRGERLR